MTFHQQQTHGQTDLTDGTWTCLIWGKIFRPYTSNLPVEFWGLAALYIVEGYNVLLHSGINNKIPFKV
eukprot:2548221-Rhodomonas_salina.1